MPATLSSSDSNDRSPDLRSPLLSPTRKPTEERESEKLCIDDMLQKYCGQFGPWQMRHFVLTSLAWALEAFHTMVMIFADREPDWRCLGGAAGSGCDVTARTVCGLKPGSWEWTGGLGSSTVAEWGLVCEEKYKVGLAQALFFGGCMIGAGIFGHLSDSFLGRKGSLTVVCIMNTIFGCLTAFSPNYWIYVLLRLLTGFSTGGVGLCAFVLATEPVGPTKRGTAGMSTFYFFSTGIAILSGIAYIFPQWRELYIASSIPSLLFLLAVLPFVSESPRWYLVRGRITEAMKLMRAIAKSNNKHLPEGVVLALDEEANNDSPTTNEEDQTYKELLDSKDAISGSLIDVVKLPMTRMRLFLAVAINFLCSVVYYGLSLNVVNLETNLYINVLLNAVAEMPAFTITAILLDKYGRKPLAIGTLWFSGVFCFAGSFVGNAGAWKVVKMVCGILGIFGMAGTYNLLFIYTTELFPTVVRNAALGCATQAAQMGAILSPFVVVLGGGLPFAVFAVCGIAGGVFAFYLPETLNKPLYDTMAGMEDGEKKRCRDVIDRIEGLPASTKITASCRRTLLKLAHSELTFLCRCCSSTASSSSTPLNLSVNIGHLEAVVHLLQQPFITGVSRVCKPIPLSTLAPHPHGQKTDPCLKIHVDIVCTLHRNPVWIIVSDRNPKYISWSGSSCGSPYKRDKSKGLKLRIQQVTAAARSAVALKPSSVILFFSNRNGLSSIVCDKLKDEFGATEFQLDFPVLDFNFDLSKEAGEWTNVLVARTYQEACAFEIKVSDTRNTVLSSESDVKDSSLGEAADTEKDPSDSTEHTEFCRAFSNLISRMEFYSLYLKNGESAQVGSLLGQSELINFDTTALIALVSGISNGGTPKLLATPESELRQRFKGNYEFVIGQVMSEIQNPILVEFGRTISGKRVIICESVRSEFKELVLMCGGPNEKLRASQLLNCLTVVPDSPSERMMNLPTTRKLALKNKVVFGTGDYWCAPTVTANMAFVRAISQTGMSLFTIEHRPRALTGD